MLTVQTPCERDIQALRHRMFQMSIKARAMVSASVQALIERNSALAQVLIDADRDVDRLEMATDHMCLRILARRQPVAKDLRVVALCVKMVTDLERIGDLGAHICEEALALNAEPAFPIDPDLARLGDWVEGRVHAAMDAFMENDVRAAWRVIDEASRTRERSDAVLASALREMASSVHDIPRTRRLYAIATHLERVGEHATNLAEMVVFMIEGHDVRTATR